MVEQCNAPRGLPRGRCGLGAWAPPSATVDGANGVGTTHEGR